jgi:hypothetical protein
MNQNWPDREQVESDCKDIGSEGYHGAASRMLLLMEQRNEAQKCLRDVLVMFSGSGDWAGMHTIRCGIHENTLKEWRKAAGNADEPEEMPHAGGES